MENMMVYSYYNNQHYLKVGSFAALSLVTFCYFIPGLGDFKIFFLFFSLFLILLILEFVNYHMIMTEFKKDITVDKVMKLAKVATYELRGKVVGITLTGIIDDKVTELRIFRLDPNLEKKVPIIAKYQRLSVTYYKKTKVVKEFHGLTS